MNGKFYMIYSLLLFCANVLFIQRVLQYIVIVIAGKEKREEAEAENDAEKTARIEYKIANARIRLVSWIAIALCGIYANIDCILNIWRFW